MSKEKKNTQNEKRKLSRQERKQIDTLIRQAKGDGKPHTAQDSIPFERMYKDGICRLANGRFLILQKSFINCILARGTLSHKTYDFSHNLLFLQ